jgi:hypothetical protein
MMMNKAYEVMEREIMITSMQVFIKWREDEAKSNPQGKGI